MRRPSPLRPIFFLAVVAINASACEEKFSDDQFGVLDLVSVYGGGTAAEPIGRLPEELGPTEGYLTVTNVVSAASEAALAQYYDFGLVPSQISARTREPTAVTTAPMYFFFTSDQQPLFSRPVREERTATDWIRGGKQVRDPNPRNFCAAAVRAGMPCAPQDLARNRTERERPYPVRERELYIDPVRQSADYQRPLVDVTPVERVGSTSEYSGLWEIVEIVAPKGYEPDSIKHADTLERAVASGKFKRRATGKVINCPMLDERTSVAPGVTDFANPRPRIELWYRRKLALCYLVNGWETLGNPQREPYFADQDEARLDTFDVARLQVGGEKGVTTKVVVPIGRAYIPSIYTDGGDGAPVITAVANNIITVGLPRRLRNDPPGYTPVRWLFEMPVPPDYRPGALRKYDEVDLANASPRAPAANSRAPVVHNLAVRGTFTPCSHPKNTLGDANVPGQSYEECGVRRRRDNLPPFTDPSNDPVCNAMGLECNKDSCFCEEKVVGYGERCGPAIAQCQGPPQQGDTPDPFSPFGLACFPPWGGHCYKVCNSGLPNTFAEQNMGKKPTEILDSRCDGVKGYSCFGFCLRNCDQNITEVDQCSTTANITEADGSTQPRPIGVGQTCQDFGVQVCTWPEGYEPAR